jgi:hypothetical protein
MTGPVGLLGGKVRFASTCTRTEALLGLPSLLFLSV